jgi:transposase
MASEFDFYIGVDWGTEAHQICVMSADGNVVCEQNVEHSGAAMNVFFGLLSKLTQTEPGRAAVAIEVPHGPVVKAFLERDYAVFSINPKQLDRFRDRHTVAGAKDDRRDAFVAANSLRTDRHCFRRVMADDPVVVRIRELSRTEETFSGQLVRTANQLSQLLLRYYPQLLKLCPDPDEPWLWALLEIAPTPQQGARLTLSRLKQLLSKHRIRRWTAEQVKEILSAPALVSAPGTVEAVSEHALLLLPHLRVLHGQKKQVADRMQALLDQLQALPADAPVSQQSRDISLLLSFPGIGRIVAGMIIAEASGALRDRDYQALRAYGGIAPVTRQSGKSKQVSMRYRCNGRLRNALHHWTRSSVQNDSHSKEQYDRLKQAGHGYSRALRGVADRLLTVLVAMLRRGESYDAARRTAVVAA